MSEKDKSKENKPKPIRVRSIHVPFNLAGPRRGEDKRKGKKDEKEKTKDP